MPLDFFPRTGRVLALVGLAFFACALTLSAQEQRVEVTRNGVTTTLVLPEYKSQGIPYASMADIARQLGGEVEVDSARAALLINSVRAEVGLNDVAVRRDDQSFALLHPVLAYQNDALIAMSDVIRMLREGFGMGTPDNPPMESALALPSVETPLVPAEPGAMSTEPLVDVLEEAPLEAISTDPGSLEDAPLESVLPREPVPTGAAFPNAASIVVAIDAGHGGDDLGIAATNGLTEKDLCLSVAEMLRRILKEKYGIATVATRDSDESLSAQSRLDAARNGNASIIVSIHGGASYAAEATGPALFAHKPRYSLSTDPKPGLKVARALADAMGSMASPAGIRVHEVSLTLLHESKVPGVLVELGNFGNPSDVTRLAEAPYQEALATAIAAGLSEALGRSGTAETVQ